MKIEKFSIYSLQFLSRVPIRWRRKPYRTLLCQHKQKSLLPSVWLHAASACASEFSFPNFVSFFERQLSTHPRSTAIVRVEQNSHLNLVTQFSRNSQAHLTRSSRNTCLALLLKRQLKAFAMHIREGPLKSPSHFFFLLRTHLIRTVRLKSPEK